MAVVPPHTNWDKLSLRDKHKKMKSIANKSSTTIDGIDQSALLNGGVAATGHRVSPWGAAPITISFTQMEGDDDHRAKATGLRPHPCWTQLLPPPGTGNLATQIARFHGGFGPRPVVFTGVI